MAVSIMKRWGGTRLPPVHISESRGIRTLHIGGDAIQSAMRLADPDALELHYTRAMMAFLLLVPEPRDVLLIGLGGGSIARFLRHRCAASRIVAIELNPQVVAAARAWFGLPPDDARLRVDIADGLAYVPAHPQCCDVLMLDAFEDGRSVPALSTFRYYQHCRRALRAGGLLVQNFMSDERRLAAYVARVETAFDGRVLQLPAANRVNTIVFAANGLAASWSLATLEKRAAVLERRLHLPYRAMLKRLVDANRSGGLIEG